MRNFNFTFFLILALIAFAFTAFSPAVNAQQPSTPQPVAATENKQGKPLFQQLNLSAEQIKQIQLINRETRDQIRQAAQKQRDARRALDAAIYSDKPNGAEVEQRAREFAEAQAMLSKLRARTEFRIRQVLSAEQLALFRELRQRANEKAFRPNQQGFPPAQNRRNRRFPLKNRPPF